MTGNRPLYVAAGTENSNMNAGERSSRWLILIHFLSLDPNLNIKAIQIRFDCH